MKRAALLALGVALAAPTATSAPAAASTILVFSKTTGFRHDSIPAAVQAVKTLGAQHGFGVDATEDGGAFTDANLAHYDAVVFLLTTGDVLDESQQAAFERYIRAGHGWVGVHSASDTEYDWAWYGGLVGAYFLDHPAIQQAVLNVAEPRNGLPARWTRTDEWYNFRSNPRSSVHVLATIDESTYQGGEMGTDHPIAWSHEYDGGRAWYTAGGHTNESWSEPLFLAHVLSGIEYAVAPRPAAAKIVALHVTVKDRRVSVTVRYTGCNGCRAELRVGETKTALRSSRGVATGTSPRLAPGHARAAVVLTGGGVRLTASRPVVIPA